MTTQPITAASTTTATFCYGAAQSAQQRKAIDDMLKAKAAKGATFRIVIEGADWGDFCVRSEGTDLIELNAKIEVVEPTVNT